MKTKIFAAAVAVALISSQAIPSEAQAGCLGGAVVGGVAGHFAHHHALLGAAAGCAVGHAMAVNKRREREAARARWYREHHPQ